MEDLDDDDEQVDRRLYSPHSMRLSKVFSIADLHSQESSSIYAFSNSQYG